MLFKKNALFHEQSITAKLLDLSQSVSLAGHEVEESTKKQIIELDKKREKELKNLETEVSELKTTQQGKIDKIASTYQKELTELQSNRLKDDYVTP